MAEVISRVDDIDHEIPAVDTVEFGFKTKRMPRRDLVIDLGQEHLDEFEMMLSRWAEYARKADKAPAVIRRQGGSARAGTAPAAPAAPESTSSPVGAYGVGEWSDRPGQSNAEKTDRRLMRKEAQEWAKANGLGHLIDGRSRLAREGYAAWREAHGWTGPLFEEWQAAREQQLPLDEPPAAVKPHTRNGSGPGRRQFTAAAR